MGQDEPRTLLESEMRQAGLSIRALAKKLAGSDNLRQIDTERTNVRRWLNPTKGISEASAARLAPHFGKPADYFYRPSQPRVRQADRLEGLAEKLAETMEELVRLQARVKKLEGRQAPGRAAPTRSQRQ